MPCFPSLPSKCNLHLSLEVQGQGSQGALPEAQQALHAIIGIAGSDMVSQAPMTLKQRMLEHMPS